MTPSDRGAGGRGIGDLTRKIRTAVGLDEAKPADDDARPGSTVPVPREPLPQRYVRKEDQHGPYMTCVDSSNIRVRVERGRSVSSSAARKAPAGSIFLDGAAQGEPIVDASRRVYSFDHHEGCVRAFTLATCEQAMVMILKGLDLMGEQWTVHANDPDLDTILAIWLLLNHRRVSADDDLRRRLMPLVRLQGTIDAHGLDLAELTGFPEPLQEQTQTVIDELRELELETKREGTWDEIDFTDYTTSALRRVDELYYSPTDVEDSGEIEELGRVWMTPKRIAIACRATTGIYEVETALRELHGDRLGLIVLAKSDDTYTLRQTDPFIGTNLDSLYRRLNLMDPKARGDQLWGGSDEIGGSPRAAGTGLSVDDIMEISRWVYHPESVARRIGSIAVALATAVGVLAAAALTTGSLRFGSFSTPRIEDLASGSLVLLGLSLLLTVLGRRRISAQLALGPPRAWWALLLLPLAAGATVAGGGWVPLHFAFTGVGVETNGWALGVATVAGLIGFELLIRGVCYGIMVTAYPIMLWTGRHFLSVPNAIASLISAGAIVCLWLPPVWIGADAAALALWPVAAVVLGIASGAARERSGSVWLPVVLHLVSAAVAWIAVSSLAG
jgi:hypothetical protein